MEPVEEPGCPQDTRIDLRGVTISGMEGTEMVEVAGVQTRLLDLPQTDGEKSRPVVLLHGWGGRLESMAPVARCLEGPRRVLALDLPGFGDAPVPDDVWGSREYADFVRNLLWARGVERAHFVGHSFGGKVALQVAVARPGLVDKLVVVGSSGLRTPPSASARAKRLISKAAHAAGTLGPPGRRVRAVVYDRIASQDYKEAGPLRPVLVKTVNEDLSGVLPEVVAPTLVVWGDTDGSVPLDHGRKMAGLIPDAGLVVFEGAGHFAYLDEPARFCRIVRHFFGSPAGNG
jgi:pimeloyl-ACP methyl ester carboxylesterase